ncbi:MAG: bifunctional shikimate kinase/3-dehydroquinate synthase [Actinomycetes bacterium]
MKGVAGRALVLVGFMGSGKSAAARSITPDALDTDVLIEAELGASVETIFRRDGEPAFRESEERITLKGLDQAAAGAGSGLISLGGGALTSERVRAALKHHTVVFLDADVDTLWKRVSRSKRPLAADRDGFDSLFEKREAAYLAAADVVLPALRRDTLASAMPDIHRLAALGRGPKLLWAEADSANYPVWIGSGIAGRVPLPGARRWAVISDGNVAGLHGDLLDSVMSRHVIEPGEEHKTLETCERLWTELATAGVTRDDGIIALGGGVVGDVAGFVAASFQRGIPIVQMPTTLVAQVDSAYGGKTGVDLPSAKNYVGAYHQPAAVVADVDLLETLPAAERAAGMAEVIKTGLIAGGLLWDHVSSGGEVDDALVLACARTKLAVVREDERDGGRRQVLNFGHTIGHAIETATEYRQFRHGEAVSIGLMAALRLSGHAGLREQVGHLLELASLPLAAPGVDCQSVMEALRSDKKRRGDGTVPFVLCEAPGMVTHGHVVPEAAVRAAVEEVCS